MREIFDNVYNKSRKEYFNKVKKYLTANTKKFIITANPETFMIAKKDSNFSQMLLSKEIDVVPDGMGIVKAAHLLNIPMKERIAGIDIATFLLEEGNRQKKRIYFFGAKEEVMQMLLSVVKEKYPDLEVCGHSNGYVDRDNVFQEIKKLKPDICLVALGIPEQETLIFSHLNQFEKGIFIGVGGSFDVISGYKKRAPKLFQTLNLEWFYRIIKEPSRLGRFYRNNVKFIFEIKKEKKK